MIHLFSAGVTLGIPHFLVDPIDVRGQQRTSTSNALMMPSPELWGAGEVLAKTPDRVYTVNDYEEFFRDVGFPLGISSEKW